MADTDFVVVGFPKCGTSALMRLLEVHPAVQVDRRNGALEAPFYASQEGILELQRQHAESGSSRNGHKYTAYIYNLRAMARLVADNPSALFIVCVRDPLRALISWREMHRRIAVAGTTHFVNADEESRAFYQSASLDAYYERFAKPRLDYAGHIRHMLHQLDEPPTIIAAQERLATEPGRVVREILSRLDVEAGGGTPVPAPTGPHVGYADAVSAVEASDELLGDIAVKRASLAALLRELSGRPGISVLS